MFPKKTCVPLSVFGVFCNTLPYTELNRVITSSLSIPYKCNNYSQKAIFALSSLLSSIDYDD